MLYETVVVVVVVEMLMNLLAVELPLLMTLVECFVDKVLQMVNDDFEQLIQLVLSFLYTYDGPHF